MKRLSFSSFLICFILAGIPLHGWAASQDSLERLCPKADKYRLQRSFYFSNLKEVVRAPQSSVEVKARFAELSSAEKWRRQAAIASLALAGNVEIFKQLLSEGDSAGMATYASNYLRSDGNLCIDPQIEKAIVRHFHDPGFSRAFLPFFDKNLYSSQAFFEILAPLEFDASDPDHYGRLVKALCATRLKGLDDHFLEIALAALPHDTPVQKRVMPGVHQSLIRYFASQQIPVFSYFRSVLAAEPRSEGVDYFQKSYAETRIVIYQALTHYDDMDSFMIFLEQIEELAREPWGPFFANDLHELLSYLRKHQLFSENKEKLPGVMVQMLGAASLPWQAGYRPPRERAGEPGFYDKQVRKEIYNLLADLDSPAAWNLMLDELSRLLRRPGSEATTLLVGTLLQELATFSENTVVDIGRLVDIAGALPEMSERMQLAEVLARHPHPAGFRFVFEQFVGSYMASNTQEIAGGVRQQIQARFFDYLLRFSAPEYRRQTRGKVDDLFVEEKLSEDRYRHMSEVLAELLGEDSPTYLALLQAKQEAKEKKIRQDLEDAQARWRQEMAEDYAQQSSEQGIAANIAALATFGPAAKKAGYWLIRVGKPILPQAHAALAEPDATPELKMQLMIVLAEIGDVSSIPLIIGAAKTEPVNGMVLKDALQALARIPQTEESRAFAYGWLEDPERTSRQRISAVAYFASHKDRQALSWSKAFSTPDTEPPLRALALYLAAMLGEKQQKDEIMKMLASTEDRALAHLLWRGLAEIASYEEFQQAVRELQPEDSWELKQMGQYVQFRNSKGREKLEIAETLLAAKTPLYSETAIGFLIGKKEFDTLATYFEERGPYNLSLEMTLYISDVAQRIFSEARRRGFDLEEKEGKIHFLPNH